MSDKEAGQKARSPEGCDENGPAAALLLSHVSIQICSFLGPDRLGPPCRRAILIATPLHQSLTWCTKDLIRVRAEWPGFFETFGVLVVMGGTDPHIFCIGIRDLLLNPALL
jgi:hypothetical protein